MGRKALILSIVIFASCAKPTITPIMEPTYRVQLFASMSINELTIISEKARLITFLPDKSRLAIEKLPVKIIKQDSLISVITPREQLASFDSIASYKPMRFKILADGVERNYFGGLHCYWIKNQIILVGEFTLEELTAAITAGELPDNFPMQARQAQAVAIRTWILFNRSRHQVKFYDFCDLTHCGVISSDEPDYNAAQATNGLILQKDNKPIEIYYCSSLAAPWDSMYSGKAADFYWQSSVAWMDLFSFLPMNQDERIIQITDSTSDGIVKRIKFNNAEFGIEYFRSIIGRKLGWDKFPGVNFSIDAIGEDSIFFNGKGRGHGLGLSQWGTYYRAIDGQDFPTILKVYFRDAGLAKVDTLQIN